MAALSPRSLSLEETILLYSISNGSLAAASNYYTNGLHLPGTNKSMAEWTMTKWAKNGFSSRIIEYNIFINRPKHQALSLNLGNGHTITLDLDEAVYANDSTTSSPDRVPAFHGFSANGTVTAPYIYVGQGKRSDFDILVRAGVDLSGKIAIARYGGPYRGLKVKNAQKHGMVGCVIFTDLADDANHLNDQIDRRSYPDGPLRNPTSVERGSVLDIALYPGDPKTPGYSSSEGAFRVNGSEVLPKIPSLPISFANADQIMRSLDGHGVGPRSLPGGLPQFWNGALEAFYSTGPNPNTTLTLTNIMEDSYTSIHNVIGIFNGTHEDEVVIVGNHRDAWVVGGAGDPNSGSAVLIELAAAFHELFKAGWQPRRTIVLSSWDMEEYGLVGSTEFVEGYLPWLSRAAVTYLSIDIACSGPIPHAGATPELHAVLEETMKKIAWPFTGSARIFPNQTLSDVWTAFNSHIEILGSGSDYTAFVHNGISALDIGSHGGKDDATYHYHSNYDSFVWMQRFGDPEFKVCTTMAQWLTLLTYRLASDHVIPYDVTRYATEMQMDMSKLRSTTAQTSCCKFLDLEALVKAINNFGTRMNRIR